MEVKNTYIVFYFHYKVNIVAHIQPIWVFSDIVEQNLGYDLTLLFCALDFCSSQKSSSRKVVDQKKRWFYTINLHFSGSRKVVDQKKKSEFAQPLFQNHFSTLFQKRGCRINGPWAVKDPSFAFSNRIVLIGSLISNCTVFV